MLKLALFLFVISLIAAVFGFTGIAAASAGVARLLFVVAVAVFAMLLLAGLVTGAALL